MTMEATTGVQQSILQGTTTIRTSMDLQAGTITESTTTTITPIATPDTQAFGIQTGIQQEDIPIEASQHM